MNFGGVDETIVTNFVGIYFRLRTARTLTPMRLS